MNISSKKLTSMSDDDLKDFLWGNITAGIVFCRLKYWRVPKRMPNTVEGQANYWKKYYNTEGGKGDPEHFIDACRKYLV